MAKSHQPDLFERLQIPLVLVLVYIRQRGYPELADNLGKKLPQVHNPGDCYWYYRNLRELARLKMEVRRICLGQEDLFDLAGILAALPDRPEVLH